MVKKGTDENLAQKIIDQSFRFPLRLASFVGKPFYLVLVSFIYLLYITGYFFRTVLKNSFNYFLSLFLTIFLDFPKWSWRNICEKTKEYLSSKFYKTNSIRSLEFLRQSKLENLYLIPKDRLKSILTGFRKKISLNKQLLYWSVKNFVIFGLNILTKIPNLVFSQTLYKTKIISDGEKHSRPFTVDLINKYLTNYVVRLLIKLVDFHKANKKTISSLAFKLKRRLRNTTFSLVHVFSSVAGLITASSKRFTGLPKTLKFGVKKLLHNLLLLPKKILQRSKKTRKTKAKRAFKLKPFLTSLRLTFLVVLFVVTTSFSSYYIFWKFVLDGLPKAEDLTSRKVAVSTKIYDRNHILLYTIYKDINRTPISLSAIPAQVKLSTLAIEDSEFYTHPGFSIRGIARALYKNIKKGQLTGGSTITQQLVKNTLLTSEKTVVRKLKEIVLAIRVEKTFSKDQILEMYLNEVGYGGTAYGVQEGARLYFGKDVGDLTLAESAVLAGIPKSPTQYSPFGSHPENALSRQKEVLHLMELNGYISAQQKEEAEKQEIKYSQSKTDIKAPHFVMYVRDILERKYGAEIVTQGGLEVLTTLDYEIQKLAEEAVANEVGKLSKLNVTNGAAIILNPQTGEVLAMVGSKDYFDQSVDGNVNVTTSLRQPGSSIKVVNYAYALEHGYTPASVIEDSPVSFIIPNQEPYTPKNYEGGYRGKISLRSALAESRNIPAVKVLNSYGVKSMIEQGQKMGITTWINPNNYGLSLTLGGGDVKLLDLAYVYATIANYGRKPDEVTVLKVMTQDGKILENFECLEQQIPFTQIAEASSSAIAINTADDCPQKQVLSPGVSFLITDILKDNNARAPSFGTNSQLVISKHPEVAVKTGTSNNLRDNLTIGYSQKYVVAIWVGNNNNSPMSRIASGVTGASPIWNRIMSSLLANEDSIEWSVPSGLVQLPICQYTATLACPGCPTKMEWFLEENKPTYACRSEQIEQIVNANKKPQILDHAWRSDENN